MKKKYIELDVDFIGEQKPLTKDEKLAISEFIRKDKEKMKRTPGNQRKAVSVKKPRVSIE